MASISRQDTRWNRRCFKEGEAVEARVMGSGFSGSWYEARVVRHRPERNRCTVVHDALLADDSDEPGPLKEVLPDCDVRPRPPPPPSDGARFEPHQRVDALYNDGWWGGVVERVLGDEGEGSDRKYVVRFPTTKEKLEFSASELRPHLDWIDGKWVVPRTQKDKRIKSQKFGGGKAPSCKSKVPHGFNLSHAGDDDSVHILDMYYDTCSEMITEGSTSQSQPVSSRPCRKQKRETIAEGSTSQSQPVSSRPCRKQKRETIEDNTRLIDCLPKIIRRSSRARRELTVSSQTAEKRLKFHLRTFLNDKFGRSMTPFEENSVGSPNVSIKTSPNTFPDHIHDEQPLTPARFSEELLLPYTPRNVIQTADKGEELSRQGDAGSENQFKSTHFGSPICNQGLPMGNDQKIKAVATRDELQQSEAPLDNGVNNCAARNKRRKKNIPRRVSINVDAKASSEAIQLEQSGCKNAGNKEINQDYGIPVVVDSNSVSHEVPSCSSQAETATEGKQLEQSECKSDGNKETYPDLGISLVVDTNSNTREVQLHSTSQVETTTQCDRCLMDHGDKILSNAMVNASPSILNGASTSPTLINTGTEALNQSPFSASVVKGWPFEKESPMWEFVESIEVISKMLQPPHFRALEQKYDKVFREGMAIGLMVTYNSLMSSKCDIKIDDPDKRFDDKETTLLELEENGFDVRILRTQLDELLRIRVKHVQLSENSSELKLLLIKKNTEEHMINSEMVEIDKAIMELKETLSRLRKRKRTVLEQKEEHDTEIYKLQLNAKLLEEDFQSVERDFKRISAAAWR